MNFLKKFLSSDLGRGSVILFIMMNIFNFLNYAFHFAMARMLTPADYGIVGVLMSLLYIYGIPSEAIQGIFSKYSSKHMAKNEEGKINYIISLGVKKLLFYGLLMFIAASIIEFFLSSYLKISFFIILLVNLSIFLILLVSIFRGVMQGMKKFSKLGWNLIIESSFRLLVAIALVLFGFGVFGAVGGLLTGFLVGVILAIYFLRDITKSKMQKANLEGVGNYSASFLGSMIAIILMYSLDIILVRAFFSAEITGQYTVLSMLSKMIFFGTISISKALFPVSSERFAKNGKTKGLFYKSAIIIALLSAVALFLFLFFPKWIIGILFGQKYLEASGYLIYTGIALTFLSFTNLVVIYGLSIERFKNYYYLFLFVILEIILGSIFHNNLLEFTIAFMFSNIIMFLGSLILIKKT